jgi:hypothetical protein
MLGRGLPVDASLLKLGSDCESKIAKSGLDLALLFRLAQRLFPVALHNAIGGFA